MDKFFIALRKTNRKVKLSLPRLSDLSSFNFSFTTFVKKRKCRSSSKKSPYQRSAFTKKKKNLIVPLNIYKLLL